MAAQGEKPLLNEILEVLEGFPDGISDQKINEQFSSHNRQNVLDAMNKLLVQKKIEVLQLNQELFYRLKAQTAGTKDLESIEEQIVYEHIERSGNQGIWIRDIRYKTNLMPGPLNKILKSLESSKKIKSVKSVLAGKKKVYMLYDVIPDSKVTGGTFYQEQEFDVEFTDLLTQETLKYLNEKSAAAVVNGKGRPLEIRNMSFATISEIQQFIGRLKIFTVQIKENDIQKILQCLGYDGKIESSTKPGPDGDPVDCFRAVAPLISQPSIVRMPCGACPISEKCSATGVITPSKCKYLTDWLNVDVNEMM
ncbi:DNA-directed RNA polymerase III subunit RPC6 [Neocloeon triangulifer]|uniref:DNA-directed RNA polymerase III subunit RPC6 n=1 Tax=Neocloeon triangulifer TaxID=2078957 RepID=UPI00286F03B8|nr:DNA-directed RNA polymerase III subunit RPC6 [Neocloeon triangulifer]XP_059477459.1 DNA-directed RNA polymerase III subunit RPC6 [Neocloeon triangulifer]